MWKNFSDRFLANFSRCFPTEFRGFLSLFCARFFENKLFYFADCIFLTIFTTKSTIMKLKNLVFVALATLLLMPSCRSHYQLSSIERERIVIDSRYDATPDAQAAAFLAPYKHQVDSFQKPVVGEAAKNLTVGRPESTLSNLLCDILVWAGKRYNEAPDFSVYNMGGIRATFSKGNITVGDVIDVAPFENKICFLSLTGEKVMELFGQIAHRGGEGVSRGVELVISPDGKLLSACLNGKEIDPKASYRVATLDFLAQGNDGLVAFKDGTNVVSPQESENNSRYIIMDYLRELKKQGKAADADVEGRIVVAHQ